MSSLIEQAAERLAQIREAGIAVPNEAAEAAQAVAERPTVAAVAQAAPTALVEDSSASQSKQIELNLEQLTAAGYLVPSAPRTHTADQYRVIKRPLIANAIGKGVAKVNHGNLIMMTSAMPGEGKSFTSINLAMSIASELDHTVMLVDADVARPSLLKKLGLDEAPGLLDLLEGKAEMSDVLMRTNIDKLTILPSGRPHPKSTELLASDAMRDLLNDMASRYSDRIIIFDSPPLLLTTESRVLAANALFVIVGGGREPALEPVAEAARQRIADHGAANALLQHKLVRGNEYEALAGCFLNKRHGQRKTVSNRFLTNYRPAISKGAHAKRVMRRERRTDVRDIALQHRRFRITGGQRAKMLCQHRRTLQDGIANNAHSGARSPCRIGMPPAHQSGTKNANPQPAQFLAEARLFRPPHATDVSSSCPSSRVCAKPLIVSGVSAIRWPLCADA